VLGGAVNDLPTGRNRQNPWRYFPLAATHRPRSVLRPRALCTSLPNPLVLGGREHNPFPHEPEKSSPAKAECRFEDKSAIFIHPAI